VNAKEALIEMLRSSTARLNEPGDIPREKNYYLDDDSNMIVISCAGHKTQISISRFLNDNRGELSFYCVRYLECVDCGKAVFEGHALRFRNSAKVVVFKCPHCRGKLKPLERIKDTP